MPANSQPVLPSFGLTRFQISLISVGSPFSFKLPVKRTEATYSVGVVSNPAKEAFRLTISVRFAPLISRRLCAVSYTHLTLPTKRIV